MNPLRIARTCPRLIGVAGLAAWWMIGGGVSRAAAASGDATSTAAMRLLKAECFSCHNQEKKKGGLVLTSRDRLLEGGDNGAVAVPGKPEGSLLARALLKDVAPRWRGLLLSPQRSTGGAFGENQRR